MVFYRVNVDSLRDVEDAILEKCEGWGATKDYLLQCAVWKRYEKGDWFYAYSPTVSWPIYDTCFLEYHTHNDYEIEHYKGNHRDINISGECERGNLGYSGEMKYFKGTVLTRGI